jgi:hypothetical protein
MYSVGPDKTTTCIYFVDLGNSVIEFKFVANCWILDSYILTEERSDGRLEKTA